MMKLSQYRHHALAAAFVLTLALPPAIQTAVDLSQGQTPALTALFARRPTASNLRALEEDAEADSWFSSLARPLVQWAKFAVFGDLGHDAVCGRDGWLFYEPGVRYLTEATRRQREMQDCIDAIRDFRDQLAVRGLHLIVVPIPGKAAVYPDKLTARPAARALESPTRLVIAKLKEAGIDVVDLFETFAKARETLADGELYLRRDTHWSPIAARIAAEAVAERILTNGDVAEGAIEYAERPVRVARIGDIVRMARVPRIERELPPELVDCFQVTNFCGEPYEDGNNSQVLVLGDSFLRIYESDEPGGAGFVAHLARKLKQPVTSIINDGGASTLVRQTLSRRADMLDGRKVVVWEFVERDIRFGAEGWQHVELASR